jgi:hypothetical protein
MNTIFWIGVAIIASPFIVRASFMGLCTARRLHDSGIRLSTTDWIVIAFLFGIGYPADWIYNWTVGWLRFGELRKFTYSSRIQYYVDTKKFKNHQDDANKWADVTYWYQYLNVADPGHIRGEL